MKKTSLTHLLFGIFLTLSFFSSPASYAADLTFYSGTSVTDWDLVDRSANFFDKNKFTANFASMPENSWIKSTGSDYSESYCGATHITKLTTDAGTKDFAPKDAVMYKFAANKKNKQITFSILDKNDHEDNTVNIAVLENGVWSFVQSASTSGDENCSSYTVKLPDDAEAVMLYIPKGGLYVYLGSTIVTDDDGSALPVKMHDVAIQTATKTISWKVGVESNIDSYQIQGSNDAKTWTDVVSVKAEGKDGYSAVLIKSSTKAGLCFWLALMVLPFMFIKQKRKITVGMLSLFLLTGTLFSCSKDKDVVESNKSDLYKYYRVQSMNGDTPVDISNIISTN